MEDILFRDGENYIECTLNGRELICTCSTDPRFHIVGRLWDANDYDALKREINEICDSYHDNRYDVACDILQTNRFYKYFVENSVHGYFDIRSREEIEEYLDEADDKVWLMRNCMISCRKPKHEVGRRSMERIFDKYNDIPDKGYDAWECGYWNGIMGALRWVLGGDKNFLDT